MLWICRAGKKGCYYPDYINQNSIYLPWQGFNVDLSMKKTMPFYRELVKEQMNTDNRTSISNWSGQLFSFVNDMQVGDYVLIPSERGQVYTFAMISGDYVFNKENILHHQREISIIHKNLPRHIFEQKVLYSLGAYRTLFKAKYEIEILNAIEQYYKI